MGKGFVDPIEPYNIDTSKKGEMQTQFWNNFNLKHNGERLSWEIYDSDLTLLLCSLPETNLVYMYTGLYEPSSYSSERNVGFLLTFFCLYLLLPHHFS